MSLTISSPSFGHNEKIPDKYTCKGDDINPPLSIEGIPESAQSLALIMDDPDAPKGTWDHWVMWNIPLISAIDENSVPEGASEGMNSWPKKGYGGPCPPSGTHRYFFKLYALDTMLELGGNSMKIDVERAIDGHILGKAELVGLYSK